MHLDLVRREEAEFPALDDPAAVTSARVWHCKYTSLARLASLENLRTLVIATYPDQTFEPLAALRGLRDLRILHFPNVHDLTPLGHLADLETLSLSSLPSWDSAGKVLTVDTFEPMGALRHLRHLELFGVRPEKGGLAPLYELSQLKSARISKLPDGEVRRFFELTGAADAHAPEPVLEE